MMWQVLSASIAGTSHIKQNRPCEDAHASRPLPHGLLALAAADGAGSAKYAARGSHFVVSKALDCLESIIHPQSEKFTEAEWKHILEQVMQQVRKDLETFILNKEEAAKTLLLEKIEESTLANQENTYSEDEGISFPEKSGHTYPQPQLGEVGIPSLNDFATTLLIALITPQWIIAAQIGDGAIVLRQDNDTFELLTQPDHGEYLNQTSFVTDIDFLRCVQYAVVPHSPNIKGLALFTDGLENLALDFEAQTAYQPFFSPLFRFAENPEATQEDLENFLYSERVCRYTSDDKTLVLAVQHEHV